MSTTWLARLLADHGHRPRLYFTIQGIADVFQEDIEDVPTALEAAARPRRKLIVEGGIKQSPAKLNVPDRRVEGGTLMLELMDDEDGTLDALFAPRRYRSTYVESDVAIADTSVDVKATSSIAEGVDVYIDAETMRVAGVSSTALTAVSRAQYGSVAQAHYGSATDGAAVHLSPPSWKGRRVYLKSYFVNDDGTTTSDLSRSEGVFRIEKAPKHLGDGRWQIQCSELSDEFYKRKIGSGLREVTIEPARVTSSAAGGVNHLVVGEAARLQFRVTGYQTQVVMRDTTDGFLCFDLNGIDTGAHELELGSEQKVANPIPNSLGSALGVPAPFNEVKSVKHVAIMGERASKIALMVLMSRLGDGTNGTSDRLPGRDRDAHGGGAWRMGAGILAAEVDVDAFDRIGGAAAPWSYVIDKEVDVADFLFEFCLHTGSIAYVTRDGQLSVRLLADEGNEAAMVVDGAVLLPGSKVAVEYGEEEITPRVQLLCNYDVLTGEFAGEVNLYDDELADRYPGGEDALALSSRTIVLEGYPQGKVRAPAGMQFIGRPAITLAVLETMLRSIMVSNGRGRAYAGGRMHLDVLQLELGDLVQMSLTAPNLEGASSISQLARLVELGPEWDEAAAVATFELIDKPYAIAPACLVASRSSGTLTLSTGTIEAGPDASTPGRMFAVGAAVQVWDISAGTHEDGVVTAVTDTTVTIDPAPTLTVEAGVDVLRMGPQDDNEATPANDDGFDGLDFIYQMPDDENAASVVEVTRWR